MTMREFTGFLSIRVGRTVIDASGLDGMFDLKLEFARDDVMSGFARAEPGAPAILGPAGDAAPSIFSAVEEQLGLKLTAGKGPVEFLVIDHVEKPTGN